MKLIIHLFETENQFGRDRVSEKNARQLAESISGSNGLASHIKSWDYYNEEQLVSFKNELLSKDADVFHVLIPGGQNAQEVLSTNLEKVSSENTLIVYNHNWDMFGRDRLQFGEIAQSHHYDLAEGQMAKRPELALLEAEAALVSSMALFTGGLFKAAYPRNSASISSKKVFNDNFHERRSASESLSSGWGRAKQELSAKISDAVKGYQALLKERAVSTNDSINPDSTTRPGM